MLRWPPILLHYYITEQCNCRCQFCDIWQLEAPGSADAAEVMTNLDAAARLGIKFVDLTGGEPLLHPDLPEMLAHARKNGLRTTVTTNGVRYPERARELAGKIDFLHFSVDAATAEAHDTLRGRQTFDRVMTGLDVARALGEKPDILFTATPENLHHLPLLAEWAHRLGLILIVNPVFSHRHKRELSREQLCELERYKYQSGVYVNTALHLLRRRGGNDPERPRCHVVDGVVVISPRNELMLPCYHFCRERIPIHADLETLWRSGKRREARKHQGSWEMCRGCTLNCYFDPGFMYRVDSFFFKSIWAKMKYSRDKYIRYPRAQKKGRLDTRPAREILEQIVLEHRHAVR